MSVTDDALQHDSHRLAWSIQPRMLLFCWLAALGAYSLLVPSGIVPPSLARIITDIGWTLASSLAAISSFRTAIALTGADRRAWLWFAAGNAAWAMGQFAWDFYELILGIEVPFPSVADIGYFAFGPLMIVGLLALRVTQEQRQLTWVRIANLGLILCSLAAISIVMLTQPFLHSAYPASAALIVAGESATITVACIISIYLLWSYAWGSRLEATALVTAALVVQTIAMVFYTRALVVAEYDVGSAFNILWLVAFALQHLAARSRLSATRAAAADESRRVQQRHGWVEALVPSVLLLCIAISGAALGEELTARTIYSASILLAAFAIVLSLREAFLHARGQQTQAHLDQVSRDLLLTTKQLESLDERRTTLEREIEVMARAGGVGLWSWDMQSEVVRFSREWKRQLGYADDEIADTFDEWRTRLHPDDYDRMTRAVADFVAHPQGEFIEEQRLRHRDGTYRWILVRGTIAYDSEGSPQRMAGSHIDITERKTMELSLRKSEAQYRDLVNDLESRVATRTRELTDADRESRNFAYAVAHDLRAPLRAIDGFSHMLEQSASQRLTTEEQTHITRVRRGAMHMASLIEGLLDYSRIEHRELRLIPIDAREFIEESLRSMEPLHTSGATVITTVASREIVADADALNLVVRNLLDNALKFRSPARPPRIEIGSYEETGCLVLTIRDNGIGFDPQYCDKIFAIFNRLHASGYEGTGIGLALVRKAVHRMHGRIWAEAKPDEGATFFVSLPLAEK